MKDCYKKRRRARRALIAGFLVTLLIALTVTHSQLSQFEDSDLAFPPRPEFPQEWIDLADEIRQQALSGEAAEERVRELIAGSTEHRKSWVLSTETEHIALNTLLTFLDRRTEALLESGQFEEAATFSAAAIRWTGSVSPGVRDRDIAEWVSWTLEGLFELLLQAVSQLDRTPELLRTVLELLPTESEWLGFPDRQLARYFEVKADAAEPRIAVRAYSENLRLWKQEWGNWEYLSREWTSLKSDRSELSVGAQTIGLMHGGALPRLLRRSNASFAICVLDSLRVTSHDRLIGLALKLWITELETGSLPSSLDGIGEAKERSEPRDNTAFRYNPEKRQLSSRHWTIDL